MIVRGSILAQGSLNIAEIASTSVIFAQQREARTPTSSHSCEDYPHDFLFYVFPCLDDTVSVSRLQT